MTWFFKTAFSKWKDQENAKRLGEEMRSLVGSRPSFRDYSLVLAINVDYPKAKLHSEIVISHCHELHHLTPPLGSTLNLNMS